MQTEETIVEYHYWKQLEKSLLRLSGESGFRAARSNSDMIFTLCQLQKKAAEQHQSLYVQAFDIVERTTLWKICEIYGCLDKLVDIIKQFHYETKAQVTVGGELSDAFVVNREAGVRASSNSFLPLPHSCAGDYERRAQLGRVFSHKDRWQTVQPCPALCPHKNTGNVYQRTALC